MLSVNPHATPYGIELEPSVIADGKHGCAGVLGIAASQAQFLRARWKMLPTLSLPMEVTSLRPSSIRREEVQSPALTALHKLSPAVTVMQAVVRSACGAICCGCEIAGM